MTKLHDFLTYKEQEKIKDMYIDGYTVEFISNTLLFSEGAINSLLREEGLLDKDSF